MRAAIRTCGCLALLLTGPTVSAADLGQLAKDSDLIFIGRVVRIIQGELDAELLKQNIKYRTDRAVLVVVEMLKGDPEVAKVTLEFPGLTQPGRLQAKKGQHGIWFLTKSSRKDVYEAKTRDRFAAESKLVLVRRAIRSTGGVSAAPETATDRKQRLAKLTEQLGGKVPADRRRLAAYQIGKMGELEAVPTLITALDDGDADVRLAVDIALRKITGYRVAVDFKATGAATRASGIKAWEEWWRANKGRTRKEILTAAAALAMRPQPDFLYVISGLSEYDDLSLLPLFQRTFDSAVRTENNHQAIVVAEYLGRAKDRGSVSKLARIAVGADLAWPSTSARLATARAIGAIVGQDFGAGTDALSNCAAWWQKHKDQFK